jgi:hypothetical protein
MLRALQSHFNARVDDDTLTHLFELGVQMLRADVQACDAEMRGRIADDILKHKMVPLPIISHPDQILDLPPNGFIEYLNEPDGDILAEDYRDGFLRCCDKAIPRGVTMVGPAISNLIPDRIKFAADCLRGAPPNVVATFHRYSPDESKSWDVSHKPYNSRLAEVAAFQQAVGPRKIANTEFGYSTGKYRPNWWSWKKTRQSDTAQAEKIRKEFQFYESYGLPFATLYQLNDGPDDTPINQFGIRDRRGQWKLQSRVFAG